VLHWQLLLAGQVRFKLFAERRWITECGGKVMSNPPPTLAQRIGDAAGVDLVIFSMRGRFEPRLLEPLADALRR
jgi:hypothetical protein